MRKVTLVGDIHGKVAQLLAIARGTTNSVIQLGDFGFGFVRVPELPENLLYIRGNHDDPAKAASRKNYIGDYGLLQLEGSEKKVFYISGAYSVDKYCRIPDVSWWEGEELSDGELSEAISLYEREKPEVVLSHEAPSAAVYRLLRLFKTRQRKLVCAYSRTSVAMQQMWEAHKPKLWVFGHYHLPGDFEMDGTRFVCLPELATMEIEL